TRLWFGSWSRSTKRMPRVVHPLVLTTHRRAAQTTRTAWTVWTMWSTGKTLWSSITRSAPH
ncbi:hypothetical protein H4S01_005900, partial [Coemansia sp. RSA 2610]